MQEFESSHGSGSEHPELERLAAFLDGRLSPEECARLRAHLARCEDCREVYAEAVHVQEEVAELVAAEVLPFPFEGEQKRGKQVYAPWAAAAAVLIAIGGFAVYRSLLSSPEIVLADLVEPLRDNPGLTSHLWEEPRYRSGNDTETEVTQRSFQVGVQQVDLRVSLEADDRKKAAEVAETMARLVRSGPLLDDLAEDFEQIAREAPSLQTAETRRRAEEALAEYEQAFVPVYRDFGTWAEAGRLSAATGDAAFFERRRNRRFLTWLGDQDESPLDPWTVGKLAEIATIWDRGKLEAEDFKSLEALLGEVIRFYEPTPS